VVARQMMPLSTGLPHLDHVFRGIMPGDNIVWQIDTVEDYKPFVGPYVHAARERRQRLVYFRFADHEPLLDDDTDAIVHHLHPEYGFETFMGEINAVINQEGRGTLFLFDCLSQLAPDWKSDRMLGNFFMLTCPHLYDRAAIAYFAIFRNYHSFHAVRPISSTTQILVDVYRRDNTIYIQPTKVQHRHADTMFMLHEWRPDQKFVPVTESAIITETLQEVPWSRSDISSYRLGFWSRTFSEAEAIQEDLDHGFDRGRAAEEYFQRLLRMLISHEEPVLELAREYLTLQDLLSIRHRMVGTGYIGGKAVGMLLSRAVLQKTDPRWDTLLEPHDSFYIGADVFYTYLVQNGYWWMMQKYRQSGSVDDEIETARRRILTGEFPHYIIDQFSDMLGYFGQSPIIVRSSSLLEDNFGNAFAGKYESVFCANQSSPHKRLEDLLCAIRTVYASTMSEEALRYRSERGLLARDEQMALLIQRVSGGSHGSLFFPQAAGVGFSFNPYVWNEKIDPKAGMIRIVFGVGTRAVDRADDDYTRVVALNAPTIRPESNFQEVRQYAQRRVDVVDLEANQLTSVDFEDAARRCSGVPLDRFASRDTALERQLRRDGLPQEFTQVLTFDDLLQNTDYVEDMRALMETVSTAYKCPVDVEFTLNFTDRDRYRINVVQCRPLQVRGEGNLLDISGIPTRDRVLEARGAVIGRSLSTKLNWIIYVVPSVYSQMGMSDRYEVARVIGEIAHAPSVRSGCIMLVGPGRWGTTTPSLGVPVRFGDIRPVSVLCEMVMMRENLIPDVSLGTHFFNEMVENDMLYLALFPNQENSIWRREFFESDMPNRLLDVCPEAGKLEHAIRVIDCGDLDLDDDIWLHADSLQQQVVCARQSEGGDDAPD
jgi:pyruvate, water dikinase